MICVLVVDERPGRPAGDRRARNRDRSLHGPRPDLMTLDIEMPRKAAVNIGAAVVVESFNNLSARLRAFAAMA